MLKTGVEGLRVRGPAFGLKLEGVVALGITGSCPEIPIPPNSKIYLEL